jgi:superfamily II DNA/RNA helicase
VFVNAKRDAEELTKMFKEIGYKVKFLSGGGL